MKRPMQLAMVLSLVTTFAGPAETCTRALYIGEDGLVITGRSMDWGEDMHSNLWVFPRGIDRNGAAGPNTVKWTSKYGSLGVSAYESGIADGMNEKGLVMNGLYLTESDYGKPDGRPTMSIMAAGQYVLDRFGRSLRRSRDCAATPSASSHLRCPTVGARRCTCLCRILLGTPPSSNGSMVSWSSIMEKNTK